MIRAPMIRASELRQAGHIVRNARDRLLSPGRLIRTGNTPYEVLHDNGLVKLRYYSPQDQSPPVQSPQVQSPQAPLSQTGTAKALTPLVIVPPLAVNMLVYDLFPERSFVKHFTSLGFPVYLIDWGSPGKQQAHYTLSTYVKRLMPEFVAKVREHHGSPTLSLQGWSMGGGLCLAYAAFHGDKDIRNIITTGTAIDGHANGVLGRQYQVLSEWLQKWRLDARKIPASMAYSPGWLNVIGFKLSDPVGSVRGYRDLIKNLHDRDYVSQHATQAAFIDNLEAYPGGVIRDWMASVWMENETARGRITLGREKAFLDQVTANILCVAGQNDTLANVDCCRGLMNVVGSSDMEFYVGPGGHTGIMSGSQAPNTVWKKTAEWLLQRSS